MLLQELVRTSRLVAEASARKSKIGLLADLLGRAGPDEIELVIAYLSGSVRQPKLGVGWATLQDVRSAPCQAPMLSVLEVDETLSRLAATAGKGSAASRGALLRALFARATTEEQEFLVRLLTGELRQGALEGIMLEAVAKSAGLPAGDVRRAAMLAGNPAYPKGALNYWKSSFLSALTDEAIDTFVDGYAACPSPMSAVFLEHVHGAATRVRPSTTAFPHRRAGYDFLVVSQWSDPALNERCIAWGRAAFDRMKPFMAEGRYVNYLDRDEAADQVAAAYGPNYRRLRRIKKKYDPSNLFRMNQNIPPA